MSTGYNKIIFDGCPFTVTSLLREKKWPHHNEFTDCLQRIAHTQHDHYSDVNHFIDRIGGNYYLHGQQAQKGHDQEN